MLGRVRFYIRYLPTIILCKRIAWQKKTYMPVWMMLALLNVGKTTSEKINGKWVKRQLTIEEKKNAYYEICRNYL